jgi:hypothetical protein
MARASLDDFGASGAADAVPELRNVGQLRCSPVVFVVPAVLPPPARPVPTAVSTVPAVLTIPAALVVPVLPEIGTITTDPAPATAIATVAGGTEDQHGRGHPPEGVEEAEAEQDHDQDEKQNEHGGPPRSGTRHHCRGLGPVRTA